MSKSATSFGGRSSGLRFLRRDTISSFLPTSVRVIAHSFFFFNPQPCAFQLRFSVGPRLDALTLPTRAQALESLLSFWIWGDFRIFRHYASVGLLWDLSFFFFFFYPTQVQSRGL